MLVSRYVQIEFADTQYRAVDAISDIRKAVEYAGLNLFGRYGVQLQYPMVTNGKVIVEVKIPKDLSDSFAIGNHLRGIALYMLKKCGGRYNGRFVGDRLLTYTEVAKPYANMGEFSIIERLDAVASFAKLLECEDSVSNDKVYRIIEILHE